MTPECPDAIVQYGQRSKSQKHQNIGRSKQTLRARGRCYRGALSPCDNLLTWGMTTLSRKRSSLWYTGMYIAGLLKTAVHTSPAQQCMTRKRWPEGHAQGPGVVPHSTAA